MPSFLGAMVVCALMVRKVAFCKHDQDDASSTSVRALVDWQLFFIVPSVLSDRDMTHSRFQIEEACERSHQVLMNHVGRHLDIPSIGLASTNEETQSVDHQPEVK
ncbi:hypothetical protein QBC35DRAFT_204336 [Podospora australis]|uniref:Secreted protein n=1 Tax=Podospora australis TaxID=1536484 RepID=A0AAN6X7P7_9PEZI|nr:hypothetical protein QBC35DRAFT_204336 [Podospora australis]